MAAPAVRLVPYSSSDRQRSELPCVELPSQFALRRRRHLLSFAVGIHLVAANPRRAMQMNYYDLRQSDAWIQCTNLSRNPNHADSQSIYDVRRALDCDYPSHLRLRI